MLPFKMVRTRSQVNKSNALNGKGYPTMGMLCPKSQHKKGTNPYISECDSLEKTAEIFILIIKITINLRYPVPRRDPFIETENIYNLDADDCIRFTREIFRKLFDFVCRDMNPTFDEIDAMLKVCEILLVNKMKLEMSEFILNCPDKFLITYANNSESSPLMFSKLHRMGLDSICNYLAPYIHYTKIQTWNERLNTPIRRENNF